MNYQTYPANPALSGFVKCYWTLDAPEEINPEKQRIVPDGCMEMIFHYGDLYRQYSEDSSFIIQPRCFVFGQITSALEIMPTGITGIFAVRFFPESFTPFASLPANEMENRAVPLHELFGAEGTLLENAVLNAPTNEKRIKIVETFLLKRLSVPGPFDKVIRSGVETIVRLNGNLTVDALSEQLNVNRRQLERKFSSVIGLSPKQLSKMIRLQATLKMLADKNFTSLASIACEGDYYDQAHFIKDFKEFTGQSPKKFYADNLKMSLLFIDSD
jgi:AraC-like DNA-binding protein